MIGGHEKPKQCALCGGSLKAGLATMPFALPDTVVVVKEVPAEVCQSCHEPYMVSSVASRIMDLVNQLRAVHAEVSIVTYSEAEPASTATPS